MEGTENKDNDKPRKRYVSLERIKRTEEKEKQEYQQYGKHTNKNVEGVTATNTSEKMDSIIRKQIPTTCSFKETETEDNYKLKRIKYK